MSISTKTGDNGTTSLLSGERIEKDSLRVEAYGSIDEINSALGMARAWSTNSQIRDSIYNTQKKLMLVMAELATANGSSSYINPESHQQIEELMSSFEKALPPLKEFLIPGDTPSAAALDLARTATRRAERQVLRLSKVELVSKDILIFLNRLSDFCFIMMRVELKSVE